MLCNHLVMSCAFYIAPGFACKRLVGRRGLSVQGSMHGLPFVVRPATATTAVDTVTYNHQPRMPNPTPPSPSPAPRVPAGRVSCWRPAPPWPPPPSPAPGTHTAPAGQCRCGAVGVKQEGRGQAQVTAGGEGGVAIQVKEVQVQRRADLVWCSQHMRHCMHMVRQQPWSM